MQLWAPHCTATATTPRRKSIEDFRAPSIAAAAALPETTALLEIGYGEEKRRTALAFCTGKLTAQKGRAPLTGLPITVLIRPLAALPSPYLASAAGLRFSCKRAASLPA